MPKHRKHYPYPTRTNRRLSTGLETVDTQWKAYHRYLFRICAEHLAPSDDLVQFALSIAKPEELAGLIEHILQRRESLALRSDAVSELASGTGTSEFTPSPQRLQQVCFRVARHHEVLHPTVVDYMVDTLDATSTTAPGTAPTCPSLPEIVSEIASLFDLTDEHTRIIIALFALEDIEPIGNMMRQATHR
ncbi:MAG: hypothetical protein ACOCYB_13115, partial [Alkalispirochaeta sp.]